MTSKVISSQLTLKLRVNLKTYITNKVLQNAQGMWKDDFTPNKGHSNYAVIEKDEYSFLVLNAFATQVLEVFLALRTGEIGSKIICSEQRPCNTWTVNILGEIKGNLTTLNLTPVHLIINASKVLKMGMALLVFLLADIW